MDERYIQNLRFKNQSLHQKQANQYETTANNLFIQLTSILISLSVGLVTFTSPVFSDVTEYSESVRIMLFLGWIFMLVSILAGIVQFVVEKKFYEKLAQYYRTVASIYATAQDSLDDLQRAGRDKESETQRNFIGQSSVIPITIQAFSFLVGLGLIMAAFHTILF